MHILLRQLLFSVLLLIAPFSYGEGAALKTMDLRQTEGQLTEITMELDHPAAKVQSYQTDNPARLVIDLFNTSNHLPQKQYQYQKGVVESITALQAGNRTRLVVKLERSVSFQTINKGRQIKIELGHKQPVIVASKAQRNTNISTESSLKAPSIRDIDFRKGINNEGQLLIQLEHADTDFQLKPLDNETLLLTFQQAELPRALRRVLDVMDFATPIENITVQQKGSEAQFLIKLRGHYNYMAYQTGQLLTLDVKPITEAEKEAQFKQKFPYSGKKLSLNFQNIDVRAILQIIAETTGLNLVTSDSVQGNVTLRLEQVPWDQALQLVMDSKGLASRQSGNVLLVAPANELNEREKEELKASQENKELAALSSEFLQIKYAKASDMALILNGAEGTGGGLLSKRGRALVDERTNTILLQDVPSSLEAIKSVINELDVPVQQVLIEARIVIARSNIGSELGVRWGGGANAAIDKGLAKLGNNDLTVDLSSRSGGYTNFNPGSGTFALGYADANILVDMELAALASEGKGEIISQPKVITANKRKALIKSGKQIPYREESSSGGTKIAFKDAVLALEVTPQITPDEHIIMDLKITQDALGKQEFDGAPAIDTNAIETQVLVNNGETIVLGGIYTSESFDQNYKIPVLGDIPLLGALFRRSEKSQEKVELLIFITPRLIENSISLN